MNQPPEDRWDQHDRNERARLLREHRDSMRQARESRMNVITVFELLGYDLTDPAEIARLNENLRYSERQRRRYERLEGSKLGWLISLVLVIVGAAMTTAAQWVTSSLRGH